MFLLAHLRVCALHASCCVEPLPHLQEETLHRCYLVYQLSHHHCLLLQMAIVLTSLTQLMLSGIPAITLANVRGFPALRHLDLSSCDSLAVSSVQATLESLAVLEVLVMDSCLSLTNLKLNMPRLRVSANHSRNLHDEQLCCQHRTCLLHAALCGIIHKLSVACHHVPCILRHGNWSSFT